MDFPSIQSMLHAPVHLILPDLVNVVMSSEEYKWWNSSLWNFVQTLCIFFLLGPNIFLSTVGKQAVSSDMNSRLYQWKHYILKQTIFGCVFIVQFAPILNKFLGLFGVDIIMAFVLHFWDLRDGVMKACFCLI
jgi:hypothetical protein